MKADKLIKAGAFKTDDQLFFEAFVEAVAHHSQHNEYFNWLFRETKLEAYSDIQNAPFIMVDIFKHYQLKSSQDIVLTLGSSGTSGQRSQIFLDQTSLDRVKELAYQVHAELGMTSSKKYNYLCFTYDPSVAGDIGTAFTDELLTSFTDKNEVFYTFQYDGKDFHYDETATLNKLKEFEKSEYSTRILGFPAFLYELLENNNIQLNLGEDSWVQTGGGWKSKADKQIPKESFRELVSRRLGLPKENIRDLFGMVEHGVPYVDDHQGRLRIPNYARVFIRDPKTLDVLPHGEMGLIQFVSSYLTSFPSISLLTTDWGRVDQDDDGFFLEILGRAGHTKNKGCALKALELM